MGAPPWTGATYAGSYVRRGCGVPCCQPASRSYTELDRTSYWLCVSRTSWKYGLSAAGRRMLQRRRDRSAARRPALRLCRYRTGTAAPDRIRPAF